MRRWDAVLGMQREIMKRLNEASWADVVAED
jgi:hypothetical protein